MRHRALAAGMNRALREQKSLLPEPAAKGPVLWLSALQETVGFYNANFALRPENAPTGVEIAAESDGRVIALRSENFSTFPFHVESVLTSNCLTILREALTHLQA
ncbi:hypothetical protein AB0E08_41660 [Streptomyces sp. NPDC048281]|uniref:hypothetical protein n=1 Tax=Streptomyces sp. NPDC048281 TaxID=3154715 RepID=UPI00342DF833